MMKTAIPWLMASLMTATVYAHGGIELGPNKGRLLELSKDETLHAEVTEKDGKLQVALLDKELKPVTVEDQVLTATAGTREKPKKVEITRSEKGFEFPVVEAGEWIIFQFKPTAEAKPVTARLHYNTKKCDPCGNPEWRCACGEEEDGHEGHDHDHDHDHDHEKK